MRRDQIVTTKFTNPTTILDPVQLSLKPHKSCTRGLHWLRWGLPLHLGQRQTQAHEAQNIASNFPRTPNYSNPTIILKKQIRTKQTASHECQPGPPSPPPRLLHPQDCMPADHETPQPILYLPTLSIAMHPCIQIIGSRISTLTDGGPISGPPPPLFPLCWGSNVHVLPTCTI